jgi:DNA-binding CsgD family transcriptional regulator
MKALARLYKLTARELQLFMGIVQFGGVSEVASNFGIAPTTVRTHLQSVFDKTGVRRQADLAQIAAKAMPPGGPPPD